MGNNIQLFEHEEFGEVRVVMIDDEPWLVGKDVAKALGYTNPQKALRDHVPDKYKRGERIVTPSGTQTTTLINEAGMYKLVMRSKLESAEKFSDWVCGEVLISIRKTGSYSVTKNTTNNDRDPLAFERERLAFERERLTVERERLAAINSIDLLTKAISELTAVERDRLALEQEKFNVENSEDAMVFKAVKQLIELAALAGDEKYIRAKLVSLATNLLVKGNFIDESDIIFKK